MKTVAAAMVLSCTLARVAVCGEIVEGKPCIAPNFRIVGTSGRQYNVLPKDRITDPLTEWVIVDTPPAGMVSATVTGRAEKGPDKIESRPPVTAAQYVAASSTRMCPSCCPRCGAKGTVLKVERVTDRERYHVIHQYPHGEGLPMFPTDIDAYRIRLDGAYLGIQYDPIYEFTYYDDNRHVWTRKEEK